MKTLVSNLDILDYVPNGSFILNKELSVLFWNVFLEDWTGIGRERIVGKNIAEFFPELVKTKYLRRLKDIFEGGPPAVFSSQLHPHLIPSRLPDGRPRIQHTTVMPYPCGDGEGYYALFAVQDVTDLSDAIRKQQIEHRKLVSEVEERKRTERALRRSERNLAKAQAITKVGSWSIDAATGAMSCSDQIFKILDESKEDFDVRFGLIFEKAVNPQDAVAIRDANRRTLEEGVKTGPIEYEIQTRVEEKRTLILEMEPVKNGEGKVLEAVGTVRDVTEAKKAQRERLRLEEKIQHAQRLESLTRLAGGVAHDFNNILMGVLGYTSLILCENSLPPKIWKYAGLIEQSAQKAAGLSHQMLAYTGNGLLSKEPVNLTSLAESMKSLLTSAVPRKAKLIYDLDSRIPAVKADPTKLKQILMNFVTNAAEALIDGTGRITISTGAEYCDREVFSEAFYDDDPVPGRYSYIEVSDTGCGMDSETLKKIFDPFFTTKFPGRGLGLAASLGIIRGHSGAIVAKSEPLKGTTIRALFPALAEKPEQRKPERTRRTESDVPRGKTVLIVDDEQIVRFAAESLLRQLGWNTVAADSGEEGIEMFKEMAEYINVAIVDLTMPGMSGEEVFHEIRKIKKDARVILSSAYSVEGVLEKLSPDGLAGFLRKPYSLAALEAELKKPIPGRTGQEYT